jgi:SAM-dependent methyltransferase
MSHPEQLEFIRIANRNIPEILKTGKVLEIGSYDVNGTTRKTFDEASEYIGVDIASGPGVDMVSFGHELVLPDNSFGISLSVNCFEHDSYWIETFRNMIRLTSPGGAVIFTCASKGFPEHGTQRSDPNLSPGTQSVGLDYYRNLTAADFESKLDLSEYFAQYKFWYLRSSCDLYFMGQIKGESASMVTFELPSNEDVFAINNLMTFPHRVARLPLRFASHMLPESGFQSFASRYWKYLNKAQNYVFGDKFSR